MDVLVICMMHVLFAHCARMAVYVAVYGVCIPLSNVRHQQWYYRNNLSSTADTLHFDIKCFFSLSFTFRNLHWELIYCKSKTSPSMISDYFKSHPLLNFCIDRESQTISGSSQDNGSSLKKSPKW